MVTPGRGKAAAGGSATQRQGGGRSSRRELAVSSLALEAKPDPNQEALLILLAQRTVSGCLATKQDVSTG